MSRISIINVKPWYGMLNNVWYSRLLSDIGMQVLWVMLPFYVLLNEHLSMVGTVNKKGIN